MSNSNEHTAITRLVTRLILLLAIAVGITPPIAYWTYSYLRIAAQLESTLTFQASALNEFINAQPDTWDIATDRLLGQLDRYIAHEKGIRVLDAKGEDVVRIAPAVRGPFITRSHTVYSFGQPVGRLEGQESCLEQLLTGLAVFAVSLACAWLLWGPIRRLPLARLAVAEKDLRAQERYQRALLDNFPFLVWLKDRESRFLAVNQKFLECTGQPSDENVIGRADVEVGRCGLADSMRGDDDAVLAPGQPTRIEAWVETSGQRRCFEIYKSPVSLDGQIIGTVGYAQDITHRKQDERRLRETLRMLEETQALSRFGGWEYDVQDGQMMWSTEVYRLYGVDRDYDVNDLARNFGFYTPESAKVVSEAFWRAVEKGVPYDLDAQFIPKNGKPMWVRTMGTPELRDGKVACIRGNFMDITEKKNMELELQLANEMLEQRVSSRTQELATTNRKMNQILSSISSILFVVGANGRLNQWNTSATEILRQPATEILGVKLQDLRLSLNVAPLVEGLEKCRKENQPMKIHNLRYENKDGKEGFLAFNVNPILAEDGELEGFLFLGDDITELKILESQLSQAQRLESIGQLAAGIAHEINTPIQYIGDSVAFLRDVFTELQRLMEPFEQLKHKGSITPESFAALAEAIDNTLRDIDYAFLQVEIPKSFDRVLEGIDRVSTIVQAMKRFSHPDRQEKRAVDINRAVENTLTVSHNEWKYVADLTTDLAPDLPAVICFPGDLNQVLLNVIINAAHAITDVVRGTQAKGRITVATRLVDDTVVIAIADTGTGIAPEIREKIFDPFFTTKEVGHGTGQGLAIAYDIVVNKHGGTLTFETEVGKGSTFFIHLPISG